MTYQITKHFGRFQCRARPQCLKYETSLSRFAGLVSSIFPELIDPKLSSPKFCLMNVSTCFISAVEGLATKHSTIHHRKYIAFIMHSRPEKTNCSFQCSQSNKKEIQRRFLHENRKQLTITRNFEENHRQLMVLTTLPIC